MTIKQSSWRAIDSFLGSRLIGFLSTPLWILACRRFVDPAFLAAKHIFVVGCGHSGTSLLLSRLDNHSKVRAIRGETRFFQLDISRRSLMLMGWNKLWSPGVVLAEKTPIHVRYCGQIKSVFPNASIVGIWREPLDVVASLYRRHDRNLELGIDRWLKDNSYLLAAMDDGSVDQVIAYEELVVEPENTLRNLQSALGLEYQFGLSGTSHEKKEWYSDAKLPAIHEVERLHALRRQDQINRDIFDGRGRYKTILNEDQIEVVKSRTEDLAQVFRSRRRPNGGYCESTV